MTFSHPLYLWFVEHLRIHDDNSTIGMFSDRTRWCLRWCVQVGNWHKVLHRLRAPAGERRHTLLPSYRCGLVGQSTVNASLLLFFVLQSKMLWADVLGNNGAQILGDAFKCRAHTPVSDFIWSTQSVCSVWVYTDQQAITKGMTRCASLGSYDMCLGFIFGLWMSPCAAVEFSACLSWRDFPLSG